MEWHCVEFGPYGILVLGFTIKVPVAWVGFAMNWHCNAVGLCGSSFLGFPCGFHNLAFHWVWPLWHFIIGTSQERPNWLDGVCKDSALHCSRPLGISFL